jgi:hypothetical protein
MPVTRFAVPRSLRAKRAPRASAIGHRGSSVDRPLSAVIAAVQASMGNLLGAWGGEGDPRPGPAEVDGDPLLEPLQPLVRSQGTSTHINSLAVIPSADGTAPRIVTGPYEEDQPIDVWESNTGAVTHSLVDHEGDVRALVAFELEPGHGHVRLASAHGMEGGGMLVLWAVDEDFRQLAAVHAHRGGVTRLLLLDKGDPEGEGRPRLVSGGGDATVKV